MLTTKEKVGVGVLTVGAALGVALLIAKAAKAATGGSSCQNFRNATDSDVSADGVQPRYMDLLNNQPVGYTVTETHNGRLWKFVVCSAGQCIPPSTFQKDVRGYVCTG